MLVKIFFKKDTFPPSEYNYVVLCMKTIGASPFMNRILELILGQCSFSIPPEYIKKQEALV